MILLGQSHSRVSFNLTSRNTHFSDSCTTEASGRDRANALVRRQVAGVIGEGRGRVAAGSRRGGGGRGRG